MKAPITGLGFMSLAIDDEQLNEVHEFFDERVPAGSNSDSGPLFVMEIRG